MSLEVSSEKAQDKRAEMWNQWETKLTQHGMLYESVSNYLRDD